MGLLEALWILYKRSAAQSLSLRPGRFQTVQVASTFSDWCKLIQSLESALDIRDGLTILKTSADAAVAVDGSYGHQAFLARLLGMHEHYDAMQARFAQP